MKHGRRRRWACELCIYEEAKKAIWKQPKPCYPKGVLAKYAICVSSASMGAVTDSFQSRGM